MEFTFLETTLILLAEARRRFHLICHKTIPVGSDGAWFKFTIHDPLVECSGCSIVSFFVAHDVLCPLETELGSVTLHVFSVGLAPLCTLHLTVDQGD